MSDLKQLQPAVRGNEIDEQIGGAQRSVSAISPIALAERNWNAVSFLQRAVHLLEINNGWWHRRASVNFSKSTRGVLPSVYLSVNFSIRARGISRRFASRSYSISRRLLTTYVCRSIIDEFLRSLSTSRSSRARPTINFQMYLRTIQRIVNHTAAFCTFYTWIRRFSDTELAGIRNGFPTGIAPVHRYCFVTR